MAQLLPLLVHPDVGFAPSCLVAHSVRLGKKKRKKSGNKGARKTLTTKTAKTNGHRRDGKGKHQLMGEFTANVLWPMGND
jgi:hypothetical protein